jgi:hypothetical protein
MVHETEGEEAEVFYKEAKQTNKRGKKSLNAGTMYAFQATRDDGNKDDVERKPVAKNDYHYQSESAALTKK